MDSAAADVVAAAPRARLAQIVFRILAVGMGAAHAAAAGLRQSMSEDGISYLDMGDAYLRGDWTMAINAVWSPLYAWILGLALWLANPSPRWEFPLVHLVNFGIYLLALVGFEFFWRRVGEAARVDAEGREVGFPEWAWVAIGYSLFLWSSLCLIKIWAATPDMLVAALVYFAGGLLVRIGATRARRTVHAAYGLVLGLAYLAKAVMFPLGFAFLAAGAVVGKDRRRAFRGTALSVGMFLAVSLPLVLALSASKQRPTFGDAGRLTYLRYVNGVPYPLWPAGFQSKTGRPEHPARLVFEDPPVYEFGAPVGGTYPLSYDPSYWYEGLTPRFEPREQARVLLASAQGYFELFIRQQGGFLATVAILLLVGGTLRVRPRFDGRWALTAVALVAFALYGLVYVEGRYVAPFVVLFWAGILSHLRLPEGEESRKLLRVSGAVLVVFMLVPIAQFEAEFGSAFLDLELPEMISTPATPQPWPARPPLERAGSAPEIAEGLQELGVRPGDAIGFVGHAFGAYFARLAGVKIVAQLQSPDASRFWDARGSARLAVLEAFAEAGAEAVIAERVPPEGPGKGWRRIGRTSHWIYFLTPPPGLPR
ncbi:MAG TPA: hypothetical protein VJP59_07280 [Gemmatimonadota bacterium]|nr:hypothetical protein [Gemmatimonadota bacterium]